MGTIFELKYREEMEDGNNIIMGLLIKWADLRHLPTVKIGSF